MNQQEKMKKPQLGNQVNVRKAINIYGSPCSLKNFKRFKLI